MLLESMKNNKNKLKFAIIGFGNMGKIHYKTIEKNGICDIPEIVDINPDASKGYENLNIHEDFTLFLDNHIENLDGAIISTPSSLHLEHALPFLDNKIPLLIEKPLTSSHDFNQEIIEVAEKNEVLVKCGLIELYNPIVQELSSKKFENLKFVHFKRHSPKTSNSRNLENIVLDLTIHDISILYKVFKPKDIEILGVDLICENNVAESSQVLLKVDDSFTVFISSSRQDQEKTRKLEIIDENATYECDLKNKYYEIKQKGEISSFDSKSITESNILNKVDMLDKPETAEIQLESFIKSILDNDTDTNHLEIVKNTHNLAYKILNS
ncbi:MAG: hypothetical protein CL470_08950 [Acidimicrobiaceae bacterium]|nr:hypothetical protein [Acidimicrobiaceae bacterium]